MSSKIERRTASIFCGGLSAGSDQVEQFGSKVVTGTPNYSVDPAVIQELSAWADGWKPALNATNNSEYLQDRNAVDLVASYQIAYLLQQGVAEWDVSTPYFTNSVVQYGGAFYKSLLDNNTGNEPDTSPTDWFSMNSQPTQTVLTSGSGTYTPPAGCVFISVRMVGGGGGATGNGGNTTLGTFTAGGGVTGPSGAGGTATGGTLNIPGAPGGASGQGGSSYFGGAGTSSASAAANSGSGADGGGSGGYEEFSITSPGALGYGVGAGGAGSPGGGSGIIVIQEFYN